MQAARPIRGAAGASTRLLRDHDVALPTDRPSGTYAIADQAVDDAVVHIRGIVAETVAKGAERVGAYLLKVFYDDDAATYASKSPQKHASLDRLVERCGTHDFPVSKTFISTAIRMVVVARALPAQASFGKLPFSHRVELLKLTSPEKIEGLSSEALAARSTVRDLRTKVAAIAVKPQVKLKAVVALRTVRRVAESLEPANADRAGFRAADFETLDPKQRAQLEREIDRACAALAGLRKLVRGA